MAPKTKGKSVATTTGTSKVASGIEKKKPNPLFKSKKKDFRIGRCIQHKRDLRRFVKWPKYIRIQRQKSILLKRLKVPPPIYQFSQTLDKQLFDNLFVFMKKYAPESKKQRQLRLKRAAESEDGVVPLRAPAVVYGINEIISLVEKKKAKLVVIAADVDPIELVIFLPSLCRRMGVPYCIVNDRARLGRIADVKKCAAVAFNKIKNEDTHSFNKLCEAIDNNYTNRFQEIRKTWGQPQMGRKAVDKVEKLERIKLREAKTLVK